MTLKPKSDFCVPLHPWSLLLCFLSQTPRWSSETDRLLCRYLAAALTLAMLPAGEMWSVVTLSPRKSKAWAFSIDCGAGISLLWDKRKTFWGKGDGVTSVQGRKVYDERTYKFAEERWRADICGLVIPRKNDRVWTFDLVPKWVPFLKREQMSHTAYVQKGLLHQIFQIHIKEYAPTSILLLRSLKMEEMTVSSSVCWTSSLDGQISRRYTSLPSKVEPV